MISPAVRAEERDLRRNEKIDTFIVNGRNILLAYDMPAHVVAPLKMALAELASHVASERVSGNLLTRASATNGLLALSDEERQLLAKTA